MHFFPSYPKVQTTLTWSRHGYIGILPNDRCLPCPCLFIIAPKWGHFLNLVTLFSDSWFLNSCMLISCRFYLCFKKIEKWMYVFSELSLKIQLWSKPDCGWEKTMRDSKSYAITVFWHSFSWAKKRAHPEEKSCKQEILKDKIKGFLCIIFQVGASWK